MKIAAILLSSICLACLAPPAAQAQRIRPGPFIATAAGAAVGTVVGAGAAYGLAYASQGLLQSQDAGIAGVAVSVVILSLPFIGAAAGAGIARNTTTGEKQLFGGSLVGAMVGAGVGALLIAGQRHFLGRNDTVSVVLFVVPFTGMSALAGW